MTALDQVIENIDLLIQRVAPLREVLDRLDAADLRYGLYAGSHVAILTSNRLSADVDFLIHDDDIDELKKVLPYATSSESELATFARIGAGNLIEFMGRANIRKGNSSYRFRLTDLAAQRLVTYRTGIATIKVVDPVDTLLHKAILQRGKSQGKHDLEDMQAVLAQTDIDKGYLKERMRETGTAELTASVWSRFGVEP